MKSVPGDAWLNGLDEADRKSLLTNDGEKSWQNGGDWKSELRGWQDHGDLRPRLGKDDFDIANIPEMVQNEGAMIRIPRSLGAAANRISIRNPIPTMEDDIWVKEGSYISGIKTLARGNKIRDVQGLIEEFRRPDNSLSKVEDWQKMRGTGIVTDGIDDYPAELHWYEAPNIGKVKWKLKRYIEGD